MNVSPIHPANTFSITLRYVLPLGLILSLVGCKPPFEKFEPKPADADAPTEYTTTESGLKYRLLRDFTGRPVELGDDVAVMMRGTLMEDDYLFQTTYHDGNLMHMNSRSVVKGMQEGLTLCGEGGMIELIVPPELAYGEKGNGPIPPNSELKFLIEVERIKRNVDESDFRTWAWEPLEPDEDMPEEFSTTERGIKYRIRVKTDRPRPSSLDSITLYYRARLNDADGEVFTDTYHRGYGQHGTLNTIPIGIREGIKQCPANGSVEFIVPPELLEDRNLGWMAIPYTDKDILPPDTPIHFIAEVSRIQYKAFPQPK